MNIFLKTSIPLFLLCFLASCSCEEETSDTNLSTEETPLNVELQLIGSTIEGLTVCWDNNVCKRTDREGMVAFEKFGNFTFKVNEMNLTTLTIEQNSSVLSPYQLFDTNETLAKETLLLLHAFDKGDDPSDAEVLLSFSPYIPKVDTIQELLVRDSNESNITYSVNDHNITIDTNSSTIARDDMSYQLELPAKKAYTQLSAIADFITFAHDKNITLDNIDTPYLLQKKTLTSFSLGSRYSLSAFAQEDDVIVEIYDQTLYTTDSAMLLKSDAKQTLITNLVSLTVVDE